MEQATLESNEERISGTWRISAPPGAPPLAVEESGTADVSGVHDVPVPAPIAALIAELNQIDELRTLRGAYEAGRAVSAYRLAADGPAAPKPGITRPSSFRQLALVPGMPMSAATLCRAASIYRLAVAMPELLEFDRIGIGHVSLVLKLPMELQMGLMRRAQAGRWSRERVAEEAEALAPRPSRHDVTSWHPDAQQPSNDQHGTTELRASAG